MILTDNGSESSNPKKIEHGPEERGFQRTRIYYCNPSAPYQKAEIEVGHEFIRRIVPKGKSFDELEQEDVERMMDHINLYQRKKLNGKSPYEAFSFYYGEDFGAHFYPAVGPLYHRSVEKNGKVVTKVEFQVQNLKVAFKM